MTLNFSDRAFVYSTDGHVYVRNDIPMRAWTRVCRVASGVPTCSKYLPDWKFGLMVAESFAADSGVALAPDGRLRVKDFWTRLYVSQQDRATVVTERERPDDPRSARIVATYSPRLNIEYSSGLEALKILLDQDSLLLNKTGRSARQWGLR